MANCWMPQRRARQTALIRQWRPWEKSTGPKSTDGKARCSRNAFKGGERPMLRRLGRELRKQHVVLVEFGHICKKLRQ